MRRSTGFLKKFYYVFIWSALLSLLAASLLNDWSLAQTLDATAANNVYIPIVSNPPAVLRRVNAPYFASSVNFGQAAIFWFGKVSPYTNYTDVRIAYTPSELYVYLAVFDRRLWYDPAHIPSDLTYWDSASLYLNMAGTSGGLPSSKAYRFDAQLNQGQSPVPWQASFQGNGSGWQVAPISFTTLPGWRGNALNDNGDDRGWVMTYHIPFTSLGLASAPPPNTLWGLGVVMHDRDSQAGPPNPDAAWPDTFHQNDLSSWGLLGFGVPVYAPPPTSNPQSVTIRNRLNGLVVTDGMVGGGMSCGGSLQDFWNIWGNTSYPGSTDFNIQDQSDVADWPCFSKVYLTFPLASLPRGKAIVSASLTLHEFGNSGEPGQAKPSWIQVDTTNQDWNVGTLTWNAAPYALENYGGAWVNPAGAFPGWPGVPYTWDISRAVADAYLKGRPLRLVLYSADSDYHSGKYFVSSNTGDWNYAARPTVQITLGDVVNK